MPKPMLQPDVPRTMPLLVALFTVALGCAAGPASAQWAWRDANRQLVYSDRPPPPSVRPADIVRQPGPNAPLAIAAPAPAAGTAAAAATPAPALGAKSLAERDLEFRKRQQEREAAEKKQADADLRAAETAQECQRARGYLRTLQDGVQVVRDDGQGNRRYLDEAQRRDEVQRLQATLARSCGG